ncbi:MAG: DUF402 domain-containing protein [Oliverpabstia sp.]|nr:DUF402 domain-containing protein [Oliverpabstia sp.]
MNEELIIKHVRMTFDGWNRSILKKRVYLSEDAENRYSLIYIDRVKEKQVWEFLESKPVVADDNFKWLVAAPKYENYVITMYMDQNMKTILWYIDMIDGQGIDEDGVYFYNDMFLDLIVLSSGEIIEDDRDEFERALIMGVISQEQYELVKKTALELKKKICEDSNWISRYCQEIMTKIERDILEDKCELCS